MIGVIFFTLCLNDLCFKRLTFRTFYRTHRGIVANLFIALIIFSVILAIFKKYGIQKDTYNTTEVDFSHLFSQLQNTFSAATRQFFITTNFIGYFYKYINFCFVLLGGVILLHNCPKNLFSLSATFLCFAGILFSSCSTTFLTGRAEYVNFEPRIEFFGILYIYIYALALIFKSKHRVLTNLTGVLLVILIFQNTTEIAYAAKIWQFGFKAEGNLSERIIKRIEDTPSFSPYKHTFVQGGTLDFRSRYFLPRRLNKIDSYTLTAPYIPWHLPSKAYSFYQPYNFFGADSDIFWLTVTPFTLNLTENLQNYLLHDSLTWPYTKGIYVDEDTIILTLSPEGKMQARQFMERIL
jgi:hypothetical protein